MLKAEDIMNRTVITVGPDTELTKAARILLERKINGLPVVDEKGTLVGILCQSDLIAQQKKMPIPSLFTFLDGLIALTSMKQIEKEVRKIAATVVADAMTADPVTVTPETGIDTVAALMVDNSFHTLPVVENGLLVGIIGKVDILKTLTGQPAQPL
jgi:CBS domain-containing protein